ncbi:hypothetical protein F5X96DRAFT_639465 [Biscogniauxia mediterranea]|nr:hypothetical protein F5X96DRAFT_639465 [Biscogniauxia mediterranea]
MSLRLSSHDTRPHRDEDATYMKGTMQRNPRFSQAEPPTTTTIPPLDTTKYANSLEPRLHSSASQRHVVIPDPVAFRFLEEDKSVTVVERRERLQGYELYLVEQWACSRQSPTLVIVTYTGDERHSVVVGVLAVPADENTWSQRLRLYFKAIQQYHARPKDTPLGELMVTNLSSFPSALTVISVPEGDIKKNRRIFIVNENLKRLGCSGRSGMTLAEPTAAAKAKFSQLFKTDDKIPFADAVIELIKLCQVALSIFGNLDSIYIDGLLCDVTETAIGDWWTEFGVEYYDVEPTDGILGPTTVAALLGLLMGARNRLSYLGAPVAKDVFDVEATERGISYFQKYQKLPRTRKLDRQTMHRLHTVTAKAAAGEGWGVQKAVKSTVSEIGGKRGDIVLGMVGGRDKGGIGDIETFDLDKFVSLASGERAKWLWLGKPKRTVAEPEKSIPDISALFGKDDAGSQSKRTHSNSLDDKVERGRRDESPGFYSTPAPGSAVSIADSPADKDAMRLGVFKNVARDARSGLGRIKDAMYSGSGLKGHMSRPSRDESSETAFLGHQSSVPSTSSAGMIPSPSSGPGNGPLNRAFTWKNKPEEYLSAMRKEKEIQSTPSSLIASAHDEGSSGERRPTGPMKGNSQRVGNGDSKLPSQAIEVRNEIPAVESSVAYSTAAESDQQGLAWGAEKRSNVSLRTPYRRHSMGGDRRPGAGPPNESRWPRRLSFGDAEEAVLRWDEIAELSDFRDLDTETWLGLQSPLAEATGHLYRSITAVEQGIEPWVEEKIKSIETIDDHYARQYEELQAVYQQYAEACHRAKQDSQDIIGEHRAHITEALKDVELQAAKLEYEINALVSRAQDVEYLVAQFEIQVDDVEHRADELKAQLETESWLHWVVRTLTGIGTGPNITRPRRHQQQQQQQQEQQHQVASSHRR